MPTCTPVHILLPTVQYHDDIVSSVFRKTQTVAVLSKRDELRAIATENESAATPKPAHMPDQWLSVSKSVCKSHRLHWWPAPRIIVGVLHCGCVGPKAEGSRPGHQRSYGGGSTAGSEW